MSASDADDVRTIYHRLIDAWNRRDAAAYAALFDDAANVVGFDGSQMNGRSEIESTLAGIFAHHQTAPYLSIVREVRLLTPDVAILRAAVGMVPPGQTDINPAVNAIQSLVGVKREGQWRIALFQNTPAQFHGRPELAQQLTEELRQLLRR
ncbi:MAG TPA: SgcJ/EcaC family oxidoreductase [Vicinamibacterales bacterium]|nr:SgcJ/EcaC family oxidoreductase [Vicinamibacterales bacterium]